MQETGPEILCQMTGLVAQGSNAGFVVKTLNEIAHTVEPALPGNL